VSRQPPTDRAPSIDAHLIRLRDAERRRAVAQAQLEERDSQLAALQQRVRAAEQLAIDTSRRLHAQLRDSEARRAAAQLECERAVARSAEAQAALAAAQAGQDARGAALRQAGDEVQSRAERAERERDATVAQGAVDRARMLAQIAELERRLGEVAVASAPVHDDVEQLVAELARAGDELDGARREIRRLKRAARQPRGEPPQSAPDAAGASLGNDTGGALEIVELERQMRAERDALERAARASRGEHAARIRELEQLVSTLSLALAATRDDVDRAARSRAWRIGHGMSRAAARVALRPDKTAGALTSALRRIEEVQQATRALPAAQSPLPVVVAPTPMLDEPVELADSDLAAQRRLLAAEVRRRLGAAPELETWPGVSIIVPTRNGRRHLERLVDGLRDCTDYPELELIVVDNGSDDGTMTWLETVTDVPIRHVANAENVSYSHANTQGAELALHPLLLFLNNDVQPFERGWLRELVASHVLGANAITGATLLHTERTRRSADGRLVQHRAIRLYRTPAGITAYNDSDGGELFGAGFGIERHVLGVSGACLLIDAATLEQLGGWSSRYRYGLEDVDLALRAGRAGLTVVTSGRTVLYHEESATRIAEGPDFTRATRETNRRTLQELWGPQLRRAYQQGRLTADTTTTDGAGPHVAITVTSLSPADGWGDWYTAHELRETLASLGWRVQLVAVGKGDQPPRLPVGIDYVITLLDRFDARHVPAEVGVIAWIRNWTDRWLDQPWFERLDVVLASSSASVERIEQRTGLRPILFPLATNAARFAVARPDPQRAVDCVFTGNHWGKDRAVQAGLAPAPGQTLAIHGKGWEQIKSLARHHAGVAAYDDLPAVYASAKLVLDDTQEPTLRYDAVNARVFDALAAGSLVLTNCAAGARELFDDSFPVWSTAEELRSTRDALLADPRLRDTLADRYREMVLTRHTYEHRAHQLVEVLREREALASFCIKIGAPDWEQAQRWGDLHFARAIERELRRRGHRCRIEVLEEWESAEGLAHDVVLHLKGLSRHHPRPGQFNVLWCISHPSELTAEECDGYDLVAIASEPFAEHMSSRTTTPVVVLEQATDPRVFYPDPDPDPAKHHDVVYVANSRNVLRPMMRELLPTDVDLAVYGANWEGLIDMRYVVAEHVPNDELRRVYSSAKVVLADHWDDMRAHGFVSNRIYDALACGARVISDDVLGLRGRFGDALVTHTSPGELRAAIDDALARSGDRPQPVVADNLTFTSTVDRLLSCILLNGPPADRP